MTQQKIDSYTSNCGRDGRNLVGAISSQVNSGDTQQNMALIAAQNAACEATIQVSSSAVTQAQSISVAEKMSQLGYTPDWTVHRRYPVYFASALADVVRF